MNSKDNCKDTTKLKKKIVEVLNFSDVENLVGTLNLLIEKKEEFNFTYGFIDAKDYFINCKDINNLKATIKIINNIIE